LYIRTSKLKYYISQNMVQLFTWY